MTNFYGQVGCCLTCEYAEKGCLCEEIECKSCEHYEKDEEKGYCTIVKTSKEKGEKWSKTVEEMKKEERILVLCPNCKTKKFMKEFPDWDEISKYYCFSCNNYWKKETVEKYGRSDS